LLVACDSRTDSYTAPEDARFERLSSEQTGVTFRNDLEMDPVMNIFNYMYFYNGGGVAVGDVNGDELPDLYFTSNQEDNRLYLNRGDFRFEDVTEAAGVAGQSGWTTGVNMADVNGDGRLDIYVCQLGEHMTFRGANQLYINLGTDENGVPVFEDQARRYNLDLVGYATQSAFFDYDRDGDLDMYMLNHSIHQNGTFGKRVELRDSIHPRAGDRLLRNDGDRFTDVTLEAGILSSVLGYGLGLAVGDINLDGWPDIYVGNDFHENDYLYLNNGDGTFREVLDESMLHTSRFSMGNDIGDLNQDGFPDLISLDMLPEDPVILKASAAEDPFDVYYFKLNFGYNYQFARNTLQINRGSVPGKPDQVRFSEIGLQAGVAATDWSWSSLLADLDNDGRQDIYIANGVLGRSNDLDYINFLQQPENQAPIQSDIVKEEDLKLTEQMPEIKVPNYVYQNLGELNFVNRSREWGLGQDSYSNGAAYADLDNDGDLDLVVNNVNDEAFIYRNRTQDTEPAQVLRVILEGEGKNPYGLGTKVILRFANSDEYIVRELQATRGYLSSVDPRLLIGLGDRDRIEELTVIWPSGRSQVLREVPAGAITLRESEAGEPFDFAAFRRRISGEPLFREVPLPGVDFKHDENLFVEFNREPLMPHMASTEGPALAVGDVDGDGLQDFYHGGGKRQAGVLYRQVPGGGFQRVRTPDFAADSLHEDVDATFVDIDQDGDQDLIVVSGGNEFEGAASGANAPRLYRNDGTGRLERDPAALPEIYLTASCVLPADVDSDGDIDLFIGGRAVTSHYGQIPRSYLLLNDGAGRYQDATGEWSEALLRPGLVKGGAWTDLNEDGRPDLILAAEWSPVQIYYNEGNRLRPSENTGLETATGWWNCVLPGDFDGDGDTDLLVGNLGNNSKLTASTEAPVRMYYTDFDDNGTAEQLLTYFYFGEERVFYTRDEIVNQLVEVKKKYLKYTDFARAELGSLIPPGKLAAAEVFEANTLESSIAWNEGGGQFRLQPIAAKAAQWSPIRAGWVADFDRDGSDDVAAFGNFYENNIQMGRYDASYGLVLLGDNAQELRPLSMEAGGLDVAGQTRRVVPIDLADGTRGMLLARNDQTPVLYQLVEAAQISMR
jgi:hypothetical protein